MNLNKSTGIVKTAGADIYYEMKGAGENVLLIHAGIADSRMWDNEFNLLAENFHVIRFDLPGFGQSDFTGGKFSYNNMINELMDQLNISEVHILAASFGGKLAIDFCLDNPEKCQSLALLSPALGGWEDSLYLQQYEAEEERLLEEGETEEAAILNFNTWIVAGRTTESIESKVKDLVIDMQMKALTKLEPASSVEEIDPEDSIYRIGDIKIPVVIIIGGHDVQDFHDISNLICKKIPTARKVTIPNAAHLANLEFPELFSRIILEFFLADRN
ncbi:alpha/beta fold hydrolase [Lentibacillus sediminis]|uniref:alpha/beta fold hydrolase n=1 Tax=Lentibacillus sediminis TaxID=1940529 RepID=UPI000C1B7F7C|nr:alpha/beta hydrolase [Lentibacillus sediminis]